MYVNFSPEGHDSYTSEYNLGKISSLAITGKSRFKKPHFFSLRSRVVWFKNNLSTESDCLAEKKFLDIWDLIFLMALLFNMIFYVKNGIFQYVRFFPRLFSEIFQLNSHLIFNDIFTTTPFYWIVHNLMLVLPFYKGIFKGDIIQRKQIRPELVWPQLKSWD